MNDFDLRKYLKNNLLPESKEYGKKMSVVNEAANVPSNIEKFAKERGVLGDVKQIARWAEKAGKRITGGTAIGKGYDTLVLDLTYQGAEVYYDTYKGTIKVNGKPVDSWETFSKAVEESVTEGANIRAHDEMNAAAKRTEKLIKIANELFPDVAKKQDGGKLLDFRPLDISQRNQVYQKYTEGSSKIKEYDHAPKDIVTADYEEENASMDEYAHNPNTDPRTEQIIQMLKDMDIDGETMEYILVKVGMDDQMANQLVNNRAEYEDEISRTVRESKELRKMAEQELHDNSNTVSDSAGNAVNINTLDISKDRPDFTDAYFVSGDYMDGTELSDEELDYLSKEYPEIVINIANQS